MPRRTPALVLALAACLGTPAAASADRAFNVLPAGQYGGVPLNEHSTDQVALYDALTPLRGKVTTQDLRRFFKPEALRPTGARTPEPVPRDGLTLTRDAWGVPHLKGRTRADAWWGAGWVSAEDRGLFMQLGRGPARAAVADVPGVNAFELAVSGRSFTPSRQAEAVLSRQQRLLVRRYGAKGRQMLRDLDAYSAGVNAFYRAQGGTPPAPWTRNDSIAVFAFVGSIFGNGGGAEAVNAEFLSELRAQLGRRHGSAAFADLMAADDPEAPVTIRRRFEFGNAGDRPLKGSPAIDAGSLELAPDPTKRTEASNFLVVGDARSRGAHTLGVMGPQLGYYYPQIVYEAHLEAPGMEVQGAFAPGIGPYMLIGRTRGYAWSLTTAQNDNRDAFLERLCGGDDRHYRHKGRCRPMTSFDAGTLGASGDQPAKQLTFDRTVHGPVIGHAEVAGRRYAVTRARSTYGREALSLAALRDMTLDRGRTPRGFFRAANEFEYTFNWAYLSHDHVATFSSGRIPLGDRRVNDLLPRLGTGAYDWKRFLPLKRHPHTVDPKRGLLLNWNNKPAKGWQPGDDVHSYGSVHRVELFSGFPRATTLEDTASVMNRAATQDLRIMEVWPVIRAVLGTSAAPDERTAQAVAVLDRWRERGGDRLDADLDGRVDDPGAAVMDAAFVPMATAVLAPRLGPLIERLRTIQEPDRAPYAADVNGSSFGGGWYGYVDKDLRRLLGRKVRGPLRLRYCGDGRLDACRTALWSALKGAVDGVAATQGADPQAWRSDATLDRIAFRPGLIPDTLRWTNRPTFQQVLEFDTGG